MGRNIDRNFTHICLLKARRGPAVQALRAQADKTLYSAYMRQVMESTPALSTIADDATDLSVSDCGVRAVHCACAGALLAPAVVIATGTFLNGVIHVGEQHTQASASGERATTGLSRTLWELDFQQRRFKTGTVLRGDLSSLDLAALDEQPSDAMPLRFSAPGVSRSHQPLLSCYVARSTPETHALVPSRAPHP